MKSHKIFYFLSGSLTVCADGPFTERLINICMHRGMPIWNVKRCGSNRIIFKTDIPSFLNIRTPAKRTRSHVRILHRHGLPFVLKRYQHRYIALFGAAVFFAMLFYASTHIMGITVFGNNRIDTATILSALDECGLSLGLKTSTIDHNSLRNQMMTKLDDLAWIGINANGSRVYIEIVERIEKEDGLDKEGAACNLVASKDGEIDALEVREGQTLVKVGSGVCKGDVLVSGIVDNSSSGFRYVQARGEVFAKTSYTKTRSFPLNYTESVPTGRQKNKYTLSLLNLQLPLFFKQSPPYENSSYYEYTSEYRIPIDILPSLFIKKQTYTEEIQESKTRTPAETIEEGTTILIDELRSELSDSVEVLEQKNSHTLNERGEVEVTVEFICRENIAEQAVIEKTLPEDISS